MKRYSFYALLVLALMAMMVLGGCSKNSPTATDETMEPIDQEYGGFTTANESPDEFLTEEFVDEDEEQDVDNGILTVPEIETYLDSAGMNIYFVRATWGKLEWDSTATTATDWSGSASINKGTLAVLRTIRFERRLGDHIEPRTDRRNVSWVSFTQPHFDGILFAIIDNDTSDAEGEFTFRTGPYSTTFTFSELDSMGMLETVDNLGNQISFISQSRKAVPFAGGFMEGRWMRDNQRGGHFVGRWIHSTGLRAGYCRGIWGTNRNGDQVMFGKNISVSGIFRGLLKGTWGRNDADGKLGWYAGRWVNASYTNVGTFKGHWKVGEISDRRGYFRGKWFSE